MRAAWKGKPFRVLAAGSTSTGLVNLRTMARSSRLTMLTEKMRPPVMSSWVSAALSTETPTSLGSKLTWVTQFAVMRFSRSPCREPIT